MNIIETHRFYIRTTNPNGFRQGQWAKCEGIRWWNNRPCFLVRFVDNQGDWWAVCDFNQYEFTDCLPGGQTP